jgi:hypothetical protein
VGVHADEALRLADLHPPPAMLSMRFNEFLSLISMNWMSATAHWSVRAPEAALRNFPLQFFNKLIWLNLFRTIIPCGFTRHLLSQSPARVPPGPTLHLISNTLIIRQ